MKSTLQQDLIAKNKIFKNKLISKYPNIKFYFHKNEKSSRKNIFFYQKKLKTKIYL